MRSRNEEKVVEGKKQGQKNENNERERKMGEMERRQEK